jgi:hypothetical protein
LHVWPGAILQWIRQRNNIKFCAYLGKSAAETLAVAKQAFKEESMSRTRKVPISETEKGETGEEQSHGHSHNFL